MFSLVACNEKTKEKKITKSKESKELREGSPTNNFLVGNYGLRRAERWEDMPSVSPEMGEIYVCVYSYLLRNRSWLSSDTTNFLVFIEIYPE